MKIYKSSLFKILKRMIFSIFVGFASLIILAFFIENDFVLYTIACLITLYLMYLVLIPGNITIEITDDGYLTIKNLSSVKKSYCLDDKEFTSYMELSHDNLISDNYCKLNIIDKKSNDEVSVDCTMLGIPAFSELIRDLKIAGCRVKRLKHSKNKK